MKMIADTNIIDGIISVNISSDSYAPWGDKEDYMEILIDGKNRNCKDLRAIFSPSVNYIKFVSDDGKEIEDETNYSTYNTYKMMRKSIQDSGEITITVYFGMSFKGEK